VIKYEAVHSISDWGALKQRLVGPKRCCFAFFHPSLPSEPLVFVEVALIQEIADSIQVNKPFKPSYPVLIRCF